MTPDPSRIIEIESSPKKLVMFFGLGVLMTAASAAVAFPLIPNSHPSAYQQTISYIGVVFFGLCTLVTAWRLMTSRGPVVTITPEGIRDTRVAAEFIPWSAVLAVKTWGAYGQTFVVLSIDPAFESRLTLTAAARWSRGPNRALGVDGLCIAPQGLTMDSATLLSICRERAARRSL